MASLKEPPPGGANSFAAVPPQQARFATARFAVLPVPYRGTSEHGGLTHLGPGAIITASQLLELYDPELDREVSEEGICTLPPLELSLGRPQAVMAQVQAAGRALFRAGKVPVMLGGEHSLTLGMAQAARERYPDLSMLTLDAHADLRDRYLGTKYSYACVMRRVLELCPLVQVGVRSLSLEERDFVRQSGHSFYSVPESYPPRWAQSIVAGLSPHVYVSLDLDVFDPSFMPAVGTPEPGGLPWERALALLRAVARERRVVGFDVMELSPNLGPPACAFAAAKLAYKLMGYIAASPRP